MVQSVNNEDDSQRKPCFMELPSSKEIGKFTSRPLVDKKIILKRNTSYPKISIVTPSYNQGEYIERTILSVLNQNYPNLEYFIIDGGSTDGSVNIIKKYEDYLTYWVSEKDEGQADAINKGFAKCSGEILAWLNSDDIYLPDALSKVAKALASEEDCDFVYGNAYGIDEKDSIVKEVRNTPLPFSRLGYLYGGFGFNQVCVFWKRDLFLKVGGLNKDYVCCMDDDLFIRFITAGAKLKFMREFLSCFRMHPSRKTATLMPVFEKEQLRAREQYLNFGYKSMAAKIIKNLVRLRRFFYYLVQGDIGWLIRVFYKKFTSGQKVG